MPLPVRVRYSTINKTVAGLVDRYYSGQGYIPVNKIAQGEGIRIEKRRWEDDVSGFLVQNSEGKVIGVNESHASVRQRFTIAHELGHAKLHEINDIHIDRGFRIDYRNSDSATGKITIEREANYFAASLLMPESFLTVDLQGKQIDVDDDRLVSKLAKKYRVSTQAMLYRLINLFG